MFSKKVAFFVFICAFSQVILAQSKVDLSEGGIFVTGDARLDYKWENFKNTDQQLNLVSSVGAGYFIRDNLAVGVSIPFFWQFMGRQLEIGAKPFADYFFDLDCAWFPYVGGNITASYLSFGSEFKLRAGLEGGVLFSLSENIALDLGLRPEFNFKLSQTQHWGLNIPAGFLGVRAIF